MCPRAFAKRLIVSVQIFNRCHKRKVTLRRNSSTQKPKEQNQSLAIEQFALSKGLILLFLVPILWLITAEFSRMQSQAKTEIAESKPKIAAVPFKDFTDNELEHKIETMELVGTNQEFNHNLLRLTKYFKSQPNSLAQIDSNLKIVGEWFKKKPNFRS